MQVYEVPFRGKDAEFGNAEHIVAHIVILEAASCGVAERFVGVLVIKPEEKLGENDGGYVGE